MAVLRQLIGSTLGDSGSLKVVTRVNAEHWSRPRRFQVMLAWLLGSFSSAQARVKKMQSGL